METLYPAKLREGDQVRVIAPSSSLGIIARNVQDIATARLEGLGLEVTFGEHVNELDEFNSSAIESRLADLHAAFSDPEVKAIMCVIGGFNSNQLLPYIDWELIQRNPKIFIGYSDSTVLQNAFFAKTGLITYSGPAYSTFGQKLYFDYTLTHFKKCLFSTDQFIIEPAAEWTDDEWYIDQEARTPIPNPGISCVVPGQAEGRIIGGNLGSLALLFGTSYMPELKDAILFLEDDAEENYRHFDRLFESLLQQPGGDCVRAIVFGRFQKESQMDVRRIERLISIRPRLRSIPILANSDFGHTSPIFTFPIGGRARIDTDNGLIELRMF